MRLQPSSSYMRAYINTCMPAYSLTCVHAHVNKYKIVSLSCTNADTPRLMKQERSGLSFATGILYSSELDKNIVNYTFVHKKRPVETQNPTQNGLICGSTNTQLLMLSPNSIPPLPSSHCAFITPRKIRRVLKKNMIISSVFFALSVNRNYITWNRVSWQVSARILTKWRSTKLYKTSFPASKRMQWCEPNN